MNKNYRIANRSGLSSLLLRNLIVRAKHTASDDKMKISTISTVCVHVMHGRWLRDTG